MMAVVTAEAEDDLNAIRHWISEDNPDRADTFIDELERRIAGLDYWPKRHPVAFQCSDGPVHRLVHRGYRVLYLVKPDVVEVLHVHHGSRDAPRFA